MILALTAKSQIQIQYDNKGNQVLKAINGTMPEASLQNGIIYTNQPDTIVLNPGVGFDTYLWQDNSNLQTFAVDTFGVFSVTLTNATCSKTITIEIAHADAAKTFIVTTGTGGDGTITPNKAYIRYDGSQLFSIIPNEGSNLLDVKLNNVSQGAINSLLLSNVRENYIIDAIFERQYFNITSETDANCIIEPSNLTIEYGKSQSFTITPNIGVVIVDVKVNGISIGAVQNFNISNVQENKHIEVFTNFSDFVINTETIGNGTITPENPTISYGEAVNFNIIPNVGSKISDVLLNGVSVGNVSSFSVDYLPQNQTLSANFEIQTFNITASTNGNGTITPVNQIVEYGETAILNLNPNEYFEISAIEVNGVSIAITNPIVITDIQEDKNIEVVFSPIVYQISTLTNGHGVITPEYSNISFGQIIDFEILPDVGYSISDVKLNNVSVGGVSTLSVSYLPQNQTILGNFEIQTFNITASTSGNGNISPESQIVEYGETAILNITPNLGYEISGIEINGIQVSIANPILITNVQEDKNIEITFSQVFYQISTLTNGNGVITPEYSNISLGQIIDFEILPDVGYTISDVKLNNVSVGGVSTLSVSYLPQNQTILANFEIQTFNVTASTNGNGNISPETQIVEFGETAILNITPNFGYEISGIEINGVQVSIANPILITNVQEDKIIEITFSPIVYQISTVTDGNGDITPEYSNISLGQIIDFEILPDVGYSISDVKLNNVSFGAVSTLSVSYLPQNQLISASFSKQLFNVSTSTDGNGIISPETLIVEYGETAILNITPNLGFEIESIIINNNPISISNTVVLSNIQEDKNIYVTFSAIEYFLFTTTFGNGTISPENPNVNYGGTITFNIIPDNNNQLLILLVDNEIVNNNTIYTISNVTEDHSITAIFETISNVPTINNGNSKIFPNPVNSTLYFSGWETTNLEVEIFDIRGILCKTENVENNFIDVNELNCGTFIIKLTDGSKTAIHKFIKNY